MRCLQKVKIGIPALAVGALPSLDQLGHVPARGGRDDRMRSLLFYFAVLLLFSVPQPGQLPSPPTPVRGGPDRQDNLKILSMSVRSPFPSRKGPDL